MPSKRTVRTCQACAQPFYCHPSDMKDGGAIFCSRACRFSKSLADRFWPKVQKSDGCWLWIGAKFANGYGEFRIGNRNALAHRVGYELTYGPIPDGLFLCHTCDVRACVRPTHFFLGTARDNGQDASTKGRLATGERNGVNLHPETRPRGERHGSKTKPESVRRQRGQFATSP